MPLLDVPKSGFVRKSVSAHRSDLTVVSDWVEGSALFFKRSISRMEIRDFLCDYEYYDSQQFAMEFVDNMWGELRRRSRWLSQTPVFDLDKDKLSPSVKWEDALGYSFCLMLTFLQRYPKSQHGKLHQSSYVQQGSLFEQFSEESLMKLGWKTLRTGWASGISNPAFTSIVTQVAAELNEDWVNKQGTALFRDAKEEGLDLVVHRPFPHDNRWGRPFYLIQCASGADWENKLHTPCLDSWGTFITFSTRPTRGFCFPLALDDDDFRRSCIRCSGLFLDRYRLLHGGTGLNAGISNTLRASLKSWLAPRVKALPAA